MDLINRLFCGAVAVGVWLCGFAKQAVAVEVWLCGFDRQAVGVVV